MKKTLISAIAIFSIAALQAQTVKVSLPNFAGKEYTYALTQGDTKDTIARGKLNASGTVILTLPASQKGYKGFAQLLIDKSVGIDFIIKNENFAVNFTDAQPTIENMKFTGSPENDFLKGSLNQKKILEKIALVKSGLEVYDKEDALYTAFTKEKIQLNLDFAAEHAVVKNSPLYAARVREMAGFLMGIGSSPDMTQEELLKEFRPFIKDKLDIDALYTSNLWSPVIINWFNMQQYAIKDDTVLLEDTKAILSRIKSNKVYTAFADKIVGLLAKAVKDDMVGALGQYVSQSGRAEKPGNNLLSAMNNLNSGAIAPVLKTATSKKTITNKTLLFFYESGCNSCENEIHQLIGNYSIVQEKGYEVISVAADLSTNAGQDHDHKFPWKEQLCDFKGFKGENFINYGVIGTPTFFVIDANGKITGRYATLIEAGIL
ncbi:peroxiredoxin family protein [Flavobacterium aquidurense]|uniref:Alkyl hydroperoxide reductase/ Thiol specific antioxidant/ Mal allergen n=1 Tax=Flavobacterium aquidurense TaxID=362413 RepID=A0A0Q1BHH7_9FLAO|nr:redoxin domain-containing protein [Flavobacterium aquidurense]KQB40122.1 Alkyl hydroperoxide reductase/ Thiol specific antioxidant/ Mal allergen [Flavobacterium aquidurense]